MAKHIWAICVRGFRGGGPNKSKLCQVESVEEINFREACALRMPIKLLARGLLGESVLIKAGLCVTSPTPSTPAGSPSLSPESP